MYIYIYIYTYIKTLAKGSAKRRSFSPEPLEKSRETQRLLSPEFRDVVIEDVVFDNNMFDLIL